MTPLGPQTPFRIFHVFTAGGQSSAAAATWFQLQETAGRVSVHWRRSAFATTRPLPLHRPFVLRSKEATAGFPPKSERAATSHINYNILSIYCMCHYQLKKTNLFFNNIFNKYTGTMDLRLFIINLSRVIFIKKGSMFRLQLKNKQTKEKKTGLWTLIHDQLGSSGLTGNIPCRLDAGVGGGGRPDRITHARVPFTLCDLQSHGVKQQTSYLFGKENIHRAVVQKRNFKIK